MPQVLKCQKDAVEVLGRWPKGLWAGPSAALLVRAMRPRQWAKNLFVLAPLFFHARLTDLHLLFRSVTACACFCALSGAAYLVNDLRDRRRDALHPLKKNRPLASGALSPYLAGLAVLVLLGASFVLAAALNRWFLFVAVTYTALMTAYSLSLKNVVLADVTCIAAGFVLRAVAGGVVISVPISPWLFICTALLSLFLALGKRRHEMSLLNDLARKHRPVLRKYNQALLDQLISITTASCLVSYLLYCVLSETALEHKGLLLTAPFMAYGLFRYLYCVYRKDKGGSPEDILFKDKVFLGNGIAYGVAVLCAMYVS